MVKNLLTNLKENKNYADTHEPTIKHLHSYVLYALLCTGATNRYECVQILRLYITDLGMKCRRLHRPFARHQEKGRLSGITAKTALNRLYFIPCVSHRLLCE